MRPLKIAGTVTGISLAVMLLWFLLGFTLYGPHGATSFWWNNMMGVLVGLFVACATAAGIVAIWWVEW